MKFSHSVVLLLAGMLAAYPEVVGAASTDPAPSPPQQAAATPAFAYDEHAPLDLLTDVSRTADGGVRISEIEYRSGATLVRAALVSPREPQGLMPGVLFVHWLGDPATSNHTEFLGDAEWLARRGFSSLLPDEPWSAADWFEHRRSNDTDPAETVATVVALRRSLDVLARTPGVDGEHLALVGHDFGAMYGALLAGADPRVRKAVFMTPTASLAEWFLLDTARPPADRTGYETRMSAFDLPAALARATFDACLLQFAAHDRYVPVARARAFAAAIVHGEKTVRTYDAGHALDLDAATDDRREWLLAHLTST